MFQSNTDIRYLWIFSSNLETEEEMWQSQDLAHHAKKISGTLDGIINTIDSSKQTVNDIANQPILDRLSKLGERHLEYGLKKEYYIVIS